MVETPNRTIKLGFTCPPLALGPTVRLTVPAAPGPLSVESPQEGHLI